MKNFLSRLFLFILSLSILLGGIEILLRTTHAFGARIAWSRPDPVLGWRFVPSGKFVSLEENDHPVSFQTNGFGWKDKDWRFEKTPGRFRIAVLGDSYVESTQVEPEKNFAALAEKNLQGLGFSTEWMNFGRSGAGQAEERLILENDVLPFRPDLVILFFFPVNDLDDLSPETSPERLRPFFTPARDGKLNLDIRFSQSSAYRLKSWITRAKEKSALISLFSQRLSLLTQEKSLRAIREKDKALSPEQLRGYLSLATARPDPVYQKNYALAKQLIREMAELTRRHQADFLLVTVDIPTYLPETEAKLKQTDPSFDPLFFENDLEEFAASLKIHSLGLESIFRKAYEMNGTAFHWNYWGAKGRPGYFEYGAHSGHWNYEGHALAAQALTEKINSLEKASSKSA